MQGRKSPRILGIDSKVLWLTYRHDIEIWGPMAERIAEQVPKGSKICVQGKLNPATWTNREGVKQTKLKVGKLASLLLFLVLHQLLTREMVVADFRHRSQVYSA